MSQSPTRERLRRVEVLVIGCTRAYFERNRHLWIERGRFFSQRDAENRKNLVVLGHQTGHKLFGQEDPIGKAIHLRGGYYEVIGVTEPPEPTTTVGEASENLDKSHLLFIPLKTMWARMGDVILRDCSGARVVEIVELSQITLTLDNVSEIKTAADSVRTLLEKSHRIPDYSIVLSHGWSR